MQFHLFLRFKGMNVTSQWRKLTVIPPPTILKKT